MSPGDAAPKNRSTLLAGVAASACARLWGSAASARIAATVEGASATCGCAATDLWRPGGHNFSVASLLAERATHAAELVTHAADSASQLASPTRASMLSAARARMAAGCCAAMVPAAVHSASSRHVRGRAVKARPRVRPRV